MSIQNLIKVVVALERLRIGLRPFVEDIFKEEFPGFTLEDLKGSLKDKPPHYWVEMPDTFRGMDISDLLLLITNHRWTYPSTVGRKTCVEVVMQRLGPIPARRFANDAEKLLDYRRRVSHHDEINSRLNDDQVRQAIVTAILLLDSIDEDEDEDERYPEAREQRAELKIMQQDLPSMGVAHPHPAPDIDFTPDTLDDYIRRRNPEPDRPNSKLERQLEEIQFRSGTRQDFEERAEAGLRDSRGLSEQAYEHLRAGNYRQAIEDYDKAILLSPEIADYYLYRGYCHEQLEEFGQAIEDYTKAIGLDPENAKYYRLRGLCHQWLEEWNQAIEDYDKAIGLDPGNADYYYFRGHCYERLEEWNQAIEDCDKAIGLDPEDAFYYYLRGLCYRLLKEYEKAIEDCDKAIGLDPENAVYYRARGQAYEAWAEAVRSSNRIPWFPWFPLLISAKRKKGKEESGRLYDKALSDYEDSRASYAS